MKLNKISTVVLAAAALLSAQSCLKDQKDVFPESSSERLQAYLDKAKQILTESETGWIMEYYLEPSERVVGARSVTPQLNCLSQKLGCDSRRE